MSVRTLVQLALILLPVVWGVWTTLRRRSGSWMGLMLFAGGSLFMLMGVGLLCGLSVVPSRSLYRSEGRLAYVESYNGALFDDHREPILIPEGARASLEEETIRSGPRKHKYGTTPARTYTLYSVLLGPPGPWQRIDSSEDRARAEARLEELKDFLEGDAPRMVLHQESDDADWFMLLFGLVAYLMGVGVMALGVMFSRTDSDVEPKTPRKRRSKRRR